MPDPAPAASAAASSSPSTASRRASSPPSRWIWIAGPVVLCALAVAWWLLSPRPVSSPPGLPLVDRLAASPSTPTLAIPVVAVTTPGVGVTSEAADPPQSGLPVDPAPVRAETRVRSSASPRAAPPVERQPPMAQTPARTEPGSAEPQQVAAAPTVAAEPQPAPAPVASVDQRCAGSANFIARDVCRIRACGNPALAGDPVCVRFREMEEANRNRMNQ